MDILLSIILLLSYSTTPTSSSKLTSSSSTSKSEPKCISVDSYHTYICTDNPEASRLAVSSSIHSEDGTVSMPASAFDMDLGVEQRITGSENEQLRIRNVLRKMYTYFEEEVLSRSEYEHVRGRWWVGSSWCILIKMLVLVVREITPHSLFSFSIWQQKRTWTMCILDISKWMWNE